MNVFCAKERDFKIKSYTTCSDIPFDKIDDDVEMPVARRQVQTRVPQRRTDEHAGVTLEQVANDVTVAALGRHRQHQLIAVRLQLGTCV